MKRRNRFFVIFLTGWPCFGAFHETFAHREDKALAAAMLTKLKREFSKVSKPQDEAEK